MRAFILICILYSVALAQESQPQTKPPDRKPLPEVNLFQEVGKCRAELSQYQQWISIRETDLLTWATAEIQKRDAEIERLKKEPPQQTSQK